MIEPSPMYGLTYRLPKRWGDPTLNLYVDDEPMPEIVRQIADLTGLDARDIDHHVEGEHGWEPHDEGYDEAVVMATKCVASGKCFL